MSGAEAWPNTPEPELRRWVHIDYDAQVPVHSPENLEITQPMQESLQDMTLPVADVPKWTRKEDRREPAIIGINTDDIAAHLAAFGNGHSHVSKEWIGKESRVYLAAQHIGLTVFDAEANIFPTPEDII